MSLKKYVERLNLMNDVFGKPRLSINKPGDRKLIQEQLENDLSPENLSCDGELSGAVLRKKRAFLDLVQKELDERDAK